MIYALLFALASFPAGDSAGGPTDAYVAEHVVLSQALDAALERAIAPGATRSDRASLVLFLRANLLPHAAAEEAVLYPAVERLLGTRGRTTAALVQDHRKIADLANGLATACNTGDLDGFGRSAVALGALIHLHFDGEEDVVLTVLQQRLNDRELGILFARLNPTAVME